jgi:hypothetical protein
MANQLKMAEIYSIVTLRAQGWSHRRIARELGIHRETVARYLALLKAQSTEPVLAGSKPANALTGSANERAHPTAAGAGHDDPKPAIAPIGSWREAAPATGGQEHGPEPASPRHPAKPCWRSVASRGCVCCMA